MKVNFRDIVVYGLLTALMVGCAFITWDMIGIMSNTRMSDQEAVACVIIVGIMGAGACFFAYILWYTGAGAWKAHVEKMARREAVRRIREEYRTRDDVDAGTIEFFLAVCYGEDSKE